MKKLASLILIIVYFTFSAGAAMHLHYCTGKYAGFSFLGKAKEKQCSKCGMNQHHDECNCCNNIIVTKKIADPHSRKDGINVPEIFIFDCVDDFPEIETPILTNASLLVSVQKQFTGNMQSSLYLLYRNFRI